MAGTVEVEGQALLHGSAVVSTSSDVVTACRSLTVLTIEEVSIDGVATGPALAFKERTSPPLKPPARTFINLAPLWGRARAIATLTRAVPTESAEKEAVVTSVVITQQS